MAREKVLLEILPLPEYGVVGVGILRSKLFNETLSCFLYVRDTS